MQVAYNDNVRIHDLEEQLFGAIVDYLVSSPVDGNFNRFRGPFPRERVGYVVQKAANRLRKCQHITEEMIQKFLRMFYHKFEYFYEKFFMASVKHGVKEVSRRLADWKEAMAGEDPDQKERSQRDLDFVTQAVLGDIYGLSQCDWRLALEGAEDSVKVYLYEEVFAGLSRAPPLDDYRQRYAVDPIYDALRRKNKCLGSDESGSSASDEENGDDEEAEDSAGNALGEESAGNAQATAEDDSESGLSSSDEESDDDEESEDSAGEQQSDDDKEAKVSGQKGEVGEEGDSEVCDSNHSQVPGAEDSIRSEEGSELSKADTENDQSAGAASLKRQNAGSWSCKRSNSSSSIDFSGP